jgi:hypothetical protein
LPDEMSILQDDASLSNDKHTSPGLNQYAYDFE